MFIRVHPWKAENMKNHKSSMNRFYSRLGSYSFLKYRGPPMELQGLLNSYWQILENSTRNFYEISVFWGVTQTDFWITHPVFFQKFNFRGISQTVFWNTRPYLDVFSGNLFVSRPGNLPMRVNRLFYSKNFRCKIEIFEINIVSRGLQITRNLQFNSLVKIVIF